MIKSLLHRAAQKLMLQPSKRPSKERGQKDLKTKQKTVNFQRSDCSTTYHVYRRYKGLKTKQKRYEVQTDMSADMLVRGTRWQAEVLVRVGDMIEHHHRKKKSFFAHHICPTLLWISFKLLLGGNVCCATHIEWGDVYRGSGNISENRLVRITFDAVFISSPKISKLHARISCKDGVFFVTNLRIKQGTWITESCKFKIIQKEVVEIESLKSSTHHSSVNDFIVINIPEEDVEPKQIILDPDDQPMWESAKTVAPTPNSAIIQLDVDDNFVINSTHLNMIRENKFDDPVMSSSSTVTYTSVYTDSEPGRVFWGADEELSDGGSPRVIVYGYDGLPMQPIAPPSPDYVPGPEHTLSPDYVLGPEYPPSPVEVPYVPEREYPKYLVPSDAEASLKDQPLPADASPTALSPVYVANSDLDEDPEEDPEEDHAYYPADGGDGDDDPSDDDDDDDDTDDEDEEPFEDEDDDEEEEHLALADSSVVPVTVRLKPPMSPSMEARIAEYAAAPTPPSPPPSPLSPRSSLLPQIPSPPLHVSSPPLPLPPPTVDGPTYAEAPLGYRAVRIRLRALLPSTHHPLHPSSPHLPPPVPTSLPLPSSPL
ncbi:putative reverse transcriptase domain-containing protein [Tanacetum coccineum]